MLGCRAPLSSAQESNRIVYSVVVPVFNEEGNVEALASRTVAAMEGLGEAFEVLFVDDGSRDRTPQLLRSLAERDPRVRVVFFTRNYGQEAAVEALYLNARGRWIIQMDGDLQNPPEEIGKLIAKRDEGFDIVYGVREGRQDSTFRVVASRTMQWSMRSIMEIELPEDVSHVSPHGGPHRAPRGRAAGATKVLQRAARLERRPHRVGEGQARAPARRDYALQLHQASQSHLRSHRRLQQQAPAVHRDPWVRFRSGRAGVGRLGHRPQAPVGLRG